MLTNAIPTRTEPWDVCVVGSGPVGLAIALELDRLGVEVLLLESGGIRDEPPLAEFSRADVADLQSHAPMEIAVKRRLGGTSWLWGGRCVPFDELDFQSRAHVPESGWPISGHDVSPWYSRASDFLHCAPATFQLDIPTISSRSQDVDWTRLERWSVEPRVASRYRKHIEQSKKITLCTHATVTGFEFSLAQSTVESINVFNAGATKRVSAKNVVIAAGGVETTRLLLNVQERWPNLFGGANGPLGRYYMGHIAGSISNIRFVRGCDAEAFDFILDESHGYFRRRFTLSEQAQQREDLLNTAFWLDNPAFYDVGHRNGALSMMFLALAMPQIGRLILPEAIRQHKLGGPPYQLLDHVKNVLLDAPRTFVEIFRLVYERYVAQPAKPGPFLRSRSGVYALAFHSEQSPSRESRITLVNDVDPSGLKRAHIDLRFSESDLNSVLRAHRILDDGLRNSGLARLEFQSADADLLLNDIKLQAHDGYHQMGTTRMGDDPAQSVVDRNLRVHGISNLSIASSSIFPTSGQANSTFLAVALGLRLSHHLFQVVASKQLL